MTGSPSNVDPIFAAIDAHRRVWSDLSANTSRLDEIANHDAAARQRLAELHDAVDEEIEKLCNVLPTTMAGISALASYATTCEDPYLVDEIMANLAEAIPNIAA